MLKLLKLLKISILFGICKGQERCITTENCRMSQNCGDDMSCNCIDGICRYGPPPNLRIVRKNTRYNNN